MRYRSAWVSISGKVFVDTWEMEQKLKEKYPDLLTVEDIEEDDVSYLDKCTHEQEQEAFKEIADEKIRNHFPTDDPIKFNESSIDLSSYRS